ncbi:hypothetical protein NMG60_11024307 [Bertholletia excelsa]
MATNRLILLRTSKPLGLASSSPSSSASSLKVNNFALFRCFCGEKRLLGGGVERPEVVARAAIAAREGTVTSESKTVTGLDLGSLLSNVTGTALLVLKEVTRRRAWRLHAQMLIERIIIDCRFFTLFAVVGSLLGSILCFVEGSFNILESYFHYFHALPQNSDQGEVVQLLIEALDMFLVGTAMLIFGIGLHVMFVGSKHLKGKGSQLPTSNLFGLFALKTLPRWVGMKSVAEAKSKIGHTMMMILQVGLLEKFKSVPLVTAFDLACFAGAVLVSSACIFLLSRLSLAGDLSNR